MSGETIGGLVPAYLGQVLHFGRPTGTCFQVHPGVLVTAHHVLIEMGCGEVGSLLQIGPLGSADEGAQAQVLAVDEQYDLALLRAEQPLDDSISVIIPAGSIALRSEGFVTGTAEVHDPGHDYRYLTASGHWEGPAGRDGADMGRFESTGVLRGMSGAPVLRLVDGALLGVVSARYNSPDHWLRDSVWVSCGDQVVRLLTSSGAVPIQQRLTHEGGAAGLLWDIPDQAKDQRQQADSVRWLGPHESAVEAVVLLTALDRASRGGTAWSEVFDQLVERALQGQYGEIGAQAFKRRVSQRGLDPRLLLRTQPFHDSSVLRWAAPLAGDHSDQPAPRMLLETFTQHLGEQLSSGLFAGFSTTCRSHLENALTLSGASSESDFLSTVSSLLPPPISTSSEAVLVEDSAKGSALEISERARKQGHSHALAKTARRMCRLPATDPRFFGRDRQVDLVSTAIRTVMAQRNTALAFLGGQPGVGTSAVAIEVGRSLKDSFEGGVHYLDLHGLIEGAARDEQTVVRVVGEALGLEAPDRESAADLFGWFHAELADRRILLILDNARSSAQVKRILSRIDSCAMLLTSRDRAQDFADPGLSFTVESLDEPAALGLLGSYRPDQEHPADALGKVAELCANLPLALRLAGARLASDPSLDLDYLYQLLREETTRLDYLESGERAVRATIRLSYQALDPAARRTLRLIPAFPGAAVTARSLSHCTDTEEHQQGVLLHRLADRSLASFAVTRAASGRPDAFFELFELIRLFASEQLIVEEEGPEVDGIRLKAARYLLDRLIEVNDQDWDADAQGELDPMPFHAAEAVAEELGDLDLASELLRNLWTLYTARNEVDTVTAVDDARFKLHIRAGQPEQAVQVRLDSAEYVLGRGDTTTAETFLREAHRVSAAIGSGVLQGKACFLLTVVLTKQDRWKEAASLTEKGVDLFVAAGRLEDAMSLAVNGARIQQKLGKPQATLRAAERAVEFAKAINHKQGLSHATFELARAHLALGQDPAAYEAALRAERLDEEMHHFADAASMARTAALAASTPDVAATAMSRAVGHIERAGDRVRQACFLVDLSSLQVRSEHFSDALATLEKAATTPVPEWPTALRREIRIRSTILTGFLPGSERHVPVRSTPDAEKDTEPNSSFIMGSALKLFRAWQDGKAPAKDARQSLVELLSSMAEYRPEQPSFWVLDRLAAEPQDRQSLSPPRTNGGEI